MPSFAAVNVTFREPTSFAEFADHLRELLDRASSADVVVLPELVTLELMTATSAWDTGDVSAALVETHIYADQFRDFLEREASQREQYILGGSHLTRSASGALRNVAVLYDDRGALVLEHEKTHLFPFERTLDISEGDEMTVHESRHGVLGINICYEAEIPECSAALVEQGAEVILCPSLTLGEAGYWRVRHTIAARTIENQVYAVHAGASSPARAQWPGSWARSSVLSPCDVGWPANGILAETDANVDSVVIAEVDLAALAENRRSGAATTHKDRRRRSDLYQSWPSHVRR